MVTDAPSATTVPAGWTQRGQLRQLQAGIKEGHTCRTAPSLCRWSASTPPLSMCRCGRVCGAAAGRSRCAEREQSPVPCQHLCGQKFQCCDTSPGAPRVLSLLQAEASLQAPHQREGGGHKSRLKSGPDSPSAIHLMHGVKLRAARLLGSRLACKQISVRWPNKLFETKLLELAGQAYPAVEGRLSPLMPGRRRY